MKPFTIVRCFGSLVASRLLTVAASVAVVGLVASAAAGQVPTASLLQIDVKDHTIYVFDVDRGVWATNPAKLSRQAPKTFESWIGIGDIVSINGAPARGTIFESSMTISSSSTLIPGQAIVDSPRGGMYHWDLDLMQADGTYLGMVQVSGLSGGPPPPGAPKSIGRANYNVLGGTGAFTGVRGYYNSTIDTIIPVRTTSAAEDPAYRRTNGGGILHLALYLIPPSPPQLTSLYHSDNRLVTNARPAAPGETLLARVTGLGPVRPAVEPGGVFPADPPATVNSPVAVTVNGEPADVLNAIGWSGTSDSYAVQFRMPGASAGVARIQVSVAWMAGPTTTIRVEDR
jgi:uncharacterized protein (TIGR03437 family)